VSYGDSRDNTKSYRRSSNAILNDQAIVAGQITYVYMPTLDRLQTIVFKSWWKRLWETDLAWPALEINGKSVVDPISKDEGSSSEDGPYRFQDY